MSAASQYKTFFDGLRGTKIFPKKVRQSAVEAIHCIINECIDQGVTDFRQIAYVLATPRGEVGQFYRLVREGFAKTEAGSIRAVTKLYQRGVISRNYALRNKKTGQSYFGRGWPQLTHYNNYKKYEALTGLPLTSQPDLMLTKEVSAFVLVHGMCTGGFTGKKLSDFFNAERTYWHTARKIVNGMDKAAKFASFAQIFHRALKHAFPSGIIPKYEEKKMQQPTSGQPIPAVHPAPTPAPQRSGGLVNFLITLGAGLFGGTLINGAEQQGAAPVSTAFDACFAAVQSGGITTTQMVLLGGVAILGSSKINLPILSRVKSAFNVLTGATKV